MKLFYHNSKNNRVAEKNKTFLVPVLFIVLLFAFADKSMGQAASATWALTSNANAVPSGNVTATAATITGVTASSTAYTTDGWSTYGWSSLTVPSTSQYYQFTVSPLSGNSFAITSLSFYGNLYNACGAYGVEVFYSLDGFNTSTQISTEHYLSTTSTQINLTGLNISVPSSNTITIRVYYFDPCDATNYVGSTYWNKLGNLIISGTTTSTCTCTSAPTVTSTIASAISVSGASSGGNVSAAGTGCSAITSEGICWNTIGSPTISDSHTSDGTTIGTYTSSITGLSPSTTYYYRAYATNCYGTAYGTVNNFATPAGNCQTETSQADFLAGTASNVDLTTSAGNVMLSNTGTQAIDQSNTNLNTSGVGITTTGWQAQTFIPSASGTTTQIDVRLFCSTCTSGTPPITADIRTTSGGLPTSTVLATSTIAGFTSATGTWYSASFGTPATLSTGTTYAIVLHLATDRTDGGTYAWYYKSSNVYGSGSLIQSSNSGSTWTAQTSYDQGFNTYVTPLVYQTSGTLTSQVHDAGAAANWESLSWTATTPTNTAVKFQVAASNSNPPTNFIGPDGTASTYFTSSSANLSAVTGTPFNGMRYIKYKAYLSTTATSVTPTLSDVTLCYCTLPTTPSCATPSAVCFGSSATITGSGSTGTSYSYWTAGNGGSQITTGTTPPGTVSSNNLSTPTTLAAGTYHYFVQGENTCGSSATRQDVTITVNAIPTATAGGPNNVCQAASPTALTLTGAVFGGSATTAAWSITSGGGSLSNTAQTSSPQVVTYTPVANFTGTVSLLLTTNAGTGCIAATSSRTINVNAIPTATAGGPDNVCQSASPVPLTLSSASVGGGASTGAWSVTSGGGTLSSTAQTASPATVTYTPAANYTGTVTLLLTTNNNSTGCSAVTATRTINVNAIPIATAGGPDNVCQSASPAPLTLSGASVGGGASTGAWSITSGGGTLSSAAQTASPATVTYTPAANYTGTVTLTLTTNNNSTGCSAVSANRTITVNASPNISLTSGTQNQAVCSDNVTIATTVYTFGGSATYAGVTGLPAGLNSSVDGGTKTVTISGLPTATGTYTITTSGQATCCAAATIQGTITLNTASTISLTSGIQNQTVCSSNGLIATTVYTYGGSATNAIVTNLPAGLSSNVNTGAKTVTISGTATAGGTYTITTSGNTAPCAAASIQGTITYNAASTATAGGPNEVCQSATPAAITLSGASIGGGATTGAWSIISGGGSLSSTSPTSSPASVTYTPVANYNGSVTLRLTSDNLSTCSTASSDRTITVHPLPTINTSGIATAVCYNIVGQSTTLAYGGTSNTPISYSIDWNAAANTAGLSDQIITTNAFASGNGTISTINIPASTASGDFNGTMTITTTYGCTATQAVSVTVISNSLKPVITSTLVCGATSVFGNTSEHGVHTITVYDGASSLGSVSVPAGQSTWLVTGIPALISGHSITAQISGTICASFPSDAVVVGGPNPGTVSASSPATLCIGATGQYSITAGDAGGSWTSGTPSVASVDVHTGKVTALNNGTSIITYTIIDGTCTKTATKTLTVSPAISAPTVSANGGVTTICKGGTPSSVTLTASGGTSYLWSNGATTSGITVDTSGSYTVRVTNGCGSTASAATVVTVNAPPVGKITGATPFCVGTTNNLTVTATAGNSTITNYQWYNTGVSLGSANGAQTTTYTASQPGTYTVLITDSNGCSSIVCP